MLFFIRDFDSGGPNLTARKFAARSEVGIDDLPIWRFMLFSSYLQKNIQILRSDSWSTIKITSRNGFSPSISSVQILTILTILSFSKNRNDQTWQKKSHFLWVILNQKVWFSIPANFQLDPMLESIKHHFGVSGHFCHIYKIYQISELGFVI